MLTDQPNSAPEPRQSDRAGRQRKISEAMIKTAIVIRAVVFFFIAAFFLAMTYAILLEPSVHALARKSSILVRSIVLASVLLPSLAIAIWDARRQSRKHFGPKA